MCLPKVAKKNILYIEHQGALGGATLLLLQLLEVLDRQKYQPFVAAPLSSSPFFLDALQALEIPYFLLPMFTWSKRSRMNIRSRVASFLRNTRESGGHIRTVKKLQDIIRREGVDLVHTNSATVIDGSIAARLAGVPHIWHIREHLGADAITSFWLGNRRATQLMGELSERIIAMSDFIKQPFKELGLDDRVEVVYEYIQPKFFAPQSGFDLKAELDLGEDAVVIGTVANGTPWKRHPDCLEVARRICPQHSNVFFVFVGHFPRGLYRHKLEETICTFGLTGRVLFTGSLSSDKNFYRGMDVLLHPVVNEPFGMAVIEAMAAGGPVVATRSGGPAEAVRHGETGFLVTPGNIEEMTYALSVLITNVELRKKLGGAARRYAVRRFGDRGRFAEQIENVYGAILKSELSKEPKTDPTLTVPITDIS